MRNAYMANDTSWVSYMTCKCDEFARQTYWPLASGYWLAAMSCSKLKTPPRVYRCSPRSNINISSSNLLRCQVLLAKALRLRMSEHSWIVLLLLLLSFCHHCHPSCPSRSATMILCWWESTTTHYIPQHSSFLLAVPRDYCPWMSLRLT